MIRVVVADDQACFLDEVMDDAPRDLQDLIERGPEALAVVRALGPTALRPLEGLRHASAVLRPPAIIAVKSPCTVHAAEPGPNRPSSPSGRVKSIAPSPKPTSLCTCPWIVSRRSPIVSI